MHVHDAAAMPYRDAWKLQESIHAQVLGGAPEQILLVEHPPVITTGRRAIALDHLLSPPDQLARLGIEVVQTDRGGDITFHGPGQIVVYPIIRLASHQLTVGSYVHGLEKVVISALADIGIPARADASAVGVWTDDAGVQAKICAIGVRIRRGVSIHGLALNLDTDLNYFNLIIPCGLSQRPVTSIQKILAGQTPSPDRVKQLLIHHLGNWLG
jgi:lipoyl(octanoyl) transferase